MLPPRLVRRLLLAPLMLGATFWLLLTLPIWILVAAAAVPLLPGRWRPLRVLWMVIVYMVYESLGILRALELWVRSGFGIRLGSQAMRDEHYALMAWFTTRVYGSAMRVLNLKVDLDERHGRDHLLAELRRPLLVFSRHAGPGDSFLIIHELLVRLGRRPRIVMKDVLQLDPLLDIVLNRLPNRFITPEPRSADRMADAIGALAEDMDARDALVIFPEGANFSERRRLHAIQKLRTRGFRRHADRATRMRHVMPPRPGGALAAIAATPAVDVMFIAHTGLDELTSAAKIWRALPMDQVVKLGWWIVPEEELPSEDDARIDWLFEEWREIDQWIEANRSPEAGR